MISGLAVFPQLMRRNCERKDGADEWYYWGVGARVSQERFSRACLLIGDCAMYIRI